MRTLYATRYFLLLVVTIFIMTVPLVYAVDGGSGTNTGGGGQNSGGGGTVPPATSGQAGDKVGLINPLKATSISEFLVAIVDVLLIFATPIIVIYIMYAGFKFVTAQGNPSEIESARTALLWAVVGGVIVLGAKLIIEVIQGTITAFSP